MNATSKSVVPRLRVKLDENLGERGRKILADAGHNVETVVEQGLAGAPDHGLIEICRPENCCLVTLDFDFPNLFVFTPEDHAGIAVIRLPRQATPEDLYSAVGVLVTALQRDTVEGKLWIIERNRVREYTPK